MEPSVPPDVNRDRAVVPSWAFGKRGDGICSSSSEQPLPLASFLPEGILVPVPGMMSFLGNAQGRLGGGAGASGRGGWEGPETSAPLPGSPSCLPTQRGQ